MALLMNYPAASFGEGAIHLRHSGEGRNPGYKEHLLCHCEESATAGEEAICLFKQATVNCFFLHCYPEVVLE